MEFKGNIDEDDSLESTLPFLESNDKRTIDFNRRASLYHLLPWIAHGIAFFILLSSSAYILSFGRPGDLECARKQSSWSPAIEAATPLRKVQFNGTLDYPSPFRGKGPSVDAAWQTIIRRDTIGAFGISDSDFQKLNQPMIPELVRFSKRQGGQISGSLEIFHQLHCVNFIRQYTYRDYYESVDIFPDSPEMTRIHVDHCLEMLRQKITCDGDVGVITDDWVQRRKSPWPNFNTWHTCRNFEGIVKWSLEHNIVSHGDKLERPSDIVGLEPPP